MAEVLAPLVLYVDDEPILLEDGIVALEEGGFRVLGVLTSEEAIVALDDVTSTLAALVTDIDLRKGLDGWEVARHAREAFPTLPVIYVSGASSHEWASKGVPGSIMLTKPYAPAQLVVAVSNATISAQSHVQTN